MSAPSGIVFLLDVDNTLLDNDRFAADLSVRLESAFGLIQRDRYWDLFQTLREELGRADYLATLQAFRTGLDDHPELLRMSEYLLEYPFAQLRYPFALDAIRHLSTLGLPIVLSDGDIVFQPRKVQRSGIWDAVEGRVLITLHKERSLDDVQFRFPAARYVMVDDKPNLLADMKLRLKEKITTVFVHQGHYAQAADMDSIAPRPDRVIERIGDLREHSSADFLEDA
ncbi:MAG: HAD family hydrolase [Steroidobacteraceae bacterium]|jgi:FMN phosphatase YigB (HAD superfamily)